MDKLIDITAPVSYTHLDVYKRQEQIYYAFSIMRATNSPYIEWKPVGLECKSTNALLPRLSAKQYCLIVGYVRLGRFNTLNTSIGRFVASVQVNDRRYELLDNIAISPHHRVIIHLLNYQLSVILLHCVTSEIAKFKSKQNVL